ncbi:MAG: ABC transporter permease [Thiobacillus sp. 63-78]|uniref:ABC transporter permease n=1 Tax=Thiobacillus sp. 63-78 TaxID=1895859 RepID=UPI00095E024A|nr:FtsX-like permease family protein [Thiobacillus sp. 63-78]OJZ09865.1 MAG: ABC transporter permease [Thiobacillus sp. 63-78]
MLEKARHLLNAGKVDFRLALRNVLRQRRRSLFALAAIGFGVTAMMLATGYIEWIFWANREEIAIPQYGHVQVSRPGYQANGKSDPLAYLLPDDPAALAAVEHLPGVKTVSQRLDFSGLVSHGESTLSFLGLGIDPAQDPSMHNVVIREGQTLDVGDPKGILMGAGLAANLGVKTGDTIVLLTNAPGGGLRAIEGHVRGLAAITVKAYNDSMLYVPIETARELLRVQGAHLWVVMLRQTEMTAATVARLGKTAPLNKLEIIPWYQLADFYNKTVALFSRQIGVVKLIIACIIVLSISNTMTMSVMERTIEIGTAMALGIRRKRILSLFLMEGGLLGILGGTIGFLAGYLLATAISYVGIPIPAGPGMAHDFTGRVIITPGIARDAFVIAISTTLLASIYPAWRASRLVIVDALRHGR